MPVKPIDELRLMVRQAQARNAELAQVLDAAGAHLLEHLGVQGQAAWGNAAILPDGSQSRDLQVDVAGVVVPLRLRASMNGGDKCIEVAGVSYRMQDVTMFVAAANEELERLVRAAICLPR